MVALLGVNCSVLDYGMIGGRCLRLLLDSSWLLGVSGLTCCG